MAYKPQTDYETYLEIMEELLNPIDATGLDLDTLKRLYESKFVYLENLRVKCFYALNNKPAQQENTFNEEDYLVILEAIKNTKKQIKNLILITINHNFTKGKASNQ